MLDLSELKCFVIDEADIFFNDKKNYQALTEVIKNNISKL